MKYIKYFEAKSKQSLKTFCGQYLAYLLDDETYKLRIEEGKSHILSDGYLYNSKIKHSIQVKNSPRFDTIIISRDQIKKVPRRNYNYDTGDYEVFTHDEIKTMSFNWNDVKDHIIPFYTLLDRRYRVVNLTFTGGGNIKSVRKEDIEKDIPFEIREIYITVRK